MLYVFLTGICIIFSSCSSFADNARFKIFSDSPANHNLSKSELVLVNKLFQKNKLDDSNLQFQSVDDRTFIGRDYTVTALQFYNGFKIFNGEIFYVFGKNEKLKQISGGVKKNGKVVASIEISTTPRLKSEEILDIFLKKIKNDKEISDKNVFKNGDISIQYGYYYLSGLKEPKFTFACLVNGKNIPNILIDDETKEVLRYDNGVIWD